MLSILAVSSWYPPHHYGGYEVWCRDVNAGLAARGHQVTVLCGMRQDRGASGPVDLDGVQVRRSLRLCHRYGDVWDPPIRERLAMERSNQRAMRGALASVRPDVVAFWHMGALSMNLITAAVEADVPCLFVVGDDWLGYGVQLDAWGRMWNATTLRRAAGRLLRPLLRVPTVVADLDRAGGACFISQFTRDRARAISPWTFSREGVVAAGVDLHRFAPESKRTGTWQGRLLYVGRLDERKGLLTLLRAVAVLGSEVHLTVDGRADAGDRTRFERLAVDAGIGHRVRWLCSAPEGLVAEYQAADCVVFPSEWPEPFGLVPLEAMACGTPVVATGVGGSSEFLRHGENAFCFRAGNPAALVAAVRRLAGSEQMRAHLVKGGIETAQRYGTDVVTDRFEKWHHAAATRFISGPVECAPLASDRIDRTVMGVRRVRVGIVSWNTADVLDRCLAALPAALDGVTADIVVVDNASEDASAAVATSHGVATIVNPENVGYARAMNQALRADSVHPGPEFLIALNPDTEAAPGSLAALVDALDHAPDAGLAVPRLINPDGSLQHSVYRFPCDRLAALTALLPRRWQRATLARRWWLEGRHPHDHAGDIDWAIGAVHVIRAAAVDPTQPYSERWFMYVEDLDLCWRLAAAGWRRLLVPAVRIAHIGNVSGGQAWGGRRTARWTGETYDWFEQVHGRGARRRWAALHLVGVTRRLCMSVPAGLVGPRNRRGDWRSEARELARLLPIHAGATFSPRPMKQAGSIPTLRAE
jgi:glycogen(starch) synthase